MLPSNLELEVLVLVLLLQPLQLYFPDYPLRVEVQYLRDHQSESQQLLVYNIAVYLNESINQLAVFNKERDKSFEPNKVR